MIHTSQEVQAALLNWIDLAADVQVTHNRHNYRQYRHNYNIIDTIIDIIIHHIHRILHIYTNNAYLFDT
jgi:hypothetical protein